MHRIPLRTALPLAVLGGLALSVAVAQQGLATAGSRATSLSGWTHRDLSTGVELRVHDKLDGHALPVSVRDLEGVPPYDVDLAAARVLCGTEALPLAPDQAGVFRGHVPADLAGPTTQALDLRVEALDAEGRVFAWLDLDGWRHVKR